MDQNVLKEIIPFVGMIVHNSFRQKEWLLVSKIAPKVGPKWPTWHHFDQSEPRGAQKEPKVGQTEPREGIPFVGMIVHNSFRQKEWLLASKIASKLDPRWPTWHQSASKCKKMVHEMRSNYKQLIARSLWFGYRHCRAAGAG